MKKNGMILRKNIMKSQKEFTNNYCRRCKKISEVGERSCPAEIVADVAGGSGRFLSLAKES